MPLFMDLHKASDYDTKPTVEDIKRNHIADLAVQHKYGVRFLQYWINEEAGLVFCLMEAPDKESCVAVHQEAHGGMPCNVIELQGGDYIAFMGDEGTVNEFDLVETPEGTLDTGYRTILVFDIIAPQHPTLLYDDIGNIIKRTAGRLVNKPAERDMLVFNSTIEAIQCALDIIQELQRLHHNKVELRIGISAGEPVTDGNDFFGKSIQLANHLCDIAQPGHLVVSSLVQQLTGEVLSQQIKANSTIKVLVPAEEQFLSELIDATQAMFAQPSFSIDDFGKKLGLSKSQLYRKIISLTGRPANQFLNDLRLQRAFRLIRNRFGNISEVAFETGFSSASYFTRSFQKRFDVSPMQIMKLDS
jgi:AraC-like DNA-binding protein